MGHLQLNKLTWRKHQPCQRGNNRNQGRLCLGFRTCSAQVLRLGRWGCSGCAHVSRLARTPTPRSACPLPQKSTCCSSEPRPSRDVSRDACEGDRADRTWTLSCVADDSTSTAVVEARPTLQRKRKIGSNFASLGPPPSESPASAGGTVRSSDRSSAIAVAPSCTARSPCRRASAPATDL